MSTAVQGVQGISDIITIAGLVNVDFADVKAIMCNSGTAMLGVGVSSGKNRAEEAAQVSSLQWTPQSKETLDWNASMSPVWHPPFVQPGLTLDKAEAELAT